MCVGQSFTKYDRLLVQSVSGLTKYIHYKVRQVLQIATVITKCGVTELLAEAVMG